MFARKANAIREATSLGSWLYGVAYRIALKALAEFGKRKKHEGLVPKREFVERRSARSEFKTKRW